jgi:hypothetical protein
MTVRMRQKIRAIILAKILTKMPRGRTVRQLAMARRGEQVVGAVASYPPAGWLLGD